MNYERVIRRTMKNRNLRIPRPKLCTVQQESSISTLFTIMMSHPSAIQLIDIDNTRILRANVKPTVVILQAIVLILFETIFSLVARALNCAVDYCDVKLNRITCSTI